MIVLGGLVVMVVVGTAALLWYDAMERRRAVRMAEAEVVSSELIPEGRHRDAAAGATPSCGRGHPAQAQADRRGPAPGE